MPPLAEVPNSVPPVGTVYQVIVAPGSMALRLVELPGQIVGGVAVTIVGALMITALKIAEF